MSTVKRSHVIHDAFFETARRYPERVAIDFQGRTLVTYRQLELLVKNACVSLCESVSPGDLVPVLLERGVEQVTTIISLSWLGAAYAPLDMDAPKTRVKAVLESLDAPIIISKPALFDQIPVDAHLSSSTKLINPTTFQAASSMPPMRDIQEDDLAAVLFTSGSTGAPKGVQLTHRNLGVAIDAWCEAQDLSASSSIFQFAAPSFDVHLIDILCALSTGARLCQVPQKEMLSDISRWIKHMRADTVHLTPSTIAALNPAEVGDLINMVTCGEAVSQSIIDCWSPRLRLSNVYGPCEVSTATLTRLTPDSNPQVLGKTTAFSHLAIVAANGTRAPPGETGQIYLSGESMSTGYWNNRSASAEKFVIFEGRTWHATGDYGSFDTDGLRLSDRFDDQVKISGKRITLSEIQSVLKPLVAHSFVRARKEPRGPLRLYALVTHQTELCAPSERISVGGPNNGSARALTVKLHSILSGFNPRLFVLDHFPLSAAGKLDVKRLEHVLDEALESLWQNGSTARQARRVLLDVSDVICDRMSLADIPEDDSLLHWGLTSADMMVVLGQLHRKYGCDLSYETIMDEPTIQRIAHLISEHKNSPGRPEEPLTDRKDAAGRLTLPTSTCQRALFTAQQIQQDTTYNCSFVYDVTDLQLDFSTLCQALQRVCSRHEILSSTYDELDEGIVQIVHPPGSLQIKGERVELRADLSVETLSRPVRDSLRKRESRVFDLTRDSPVDVAMYDIQDSRDIRKRKSILHVLMHHVAFDEWCYGNLCADFEAEYQNLLDGQPFLSSTPASDVSYRDFVSWEHQYLATYGQDNEAWWRQRAASTDTASLLSTIKLPQTHTATARSNSYLHLELDGDQVLQFHAQMSAGHTPFVSWATLLQALFALQFNRRSFALGVPTSLRAMKAAVESTVGYFLTTQVLPADVDPEETFETLQTRVATSYRQTIQHYLPYDDVVAALASGGSGGSRAKSLPNIDVHIIHHDQRHAQEPQANSGSMFNDSRRLSFDKSASAFPLHVHIYESSKKPLIKFQYHTAALRESDVQTLAQNLTTLFRALLHSDQSQSISQIWASSHPAEFAAPNLASVPSTAEQIPIDRPASKALALPLSETLSTIWSDVLKTPRDKLKLDTSFFRSGGDSISAILFCSRAKAKGIQGCTVLRLYKNPTLSSLTKVLEPLQDAALVSNGAAISPSKSIDLPHMSAKSTSTPASAVLSPETVRALEKHGLSSSDVACAYDTTSMQSSMLLQSMLAPENYSAQSVVNLDGLMSAEHLQEAWRQLCHAHAILRTSFVAVYKRNSMAMQAVEFKVKSPLLLQCQVLQVSLDEQGKTHQLEHDRLQGFELARAMCRLTLLQDKQRNTSCIIFNRHHALLDAWSMNILLHDLANLCCGVVPSPSSTTMRHVILSQSKLDNAEAKLFWKQYLQGATPIRLPKTQSPEASRTDILSHWQPLEWSKVQERCDELGVSPMSLFQTTLAFALQQYQNTHDVVFGVSTSGRNIDVGDVERIVGMTVNSVLCRAKLDATASFSACVADVHSSFQNCVLHDQLPYGEILKCTTLPGQAPDILLTFNNQTFPAGLDYGNGTKTLEVQGFNTTEVPLTLFVQPFQDKTHIQIKYNSRQFSTEFARLFLSHFVKAFFLSLNKSVDGETVKSFASRAHLSDVECKLVNVSMNTPSTPYTLVDAIRESERAHSHSIALEAWDCSMTYEKLGQLTDGLAVQLQKLTGGKKMTIPIFFEQSSSMIVAMIGILKAGCSFAPLATDAPFQRLDGIVSSLDAEFVLTSEQLQSKFNQLSHLRVKIHNLERLIGAQTATTPNTVIHSTDLCYVLMTSGTTASPKGCMLSHGAVSHSILAASRVYGMSQSTKTLLFASYVFDACMTDIFGTLVSGATLCLAKRADLMNNLSGAVTSYGATFLHATPSILQTAGTHGLESLETVVSGGEPLSLETRSRFASVARLFDSYGPTECAIQVSATSIQSKDKPPVLTPLEGTFMLLCDENLRPVAEGEDGELLIAGPQLFSGYLKDPQATQKALVELPWLPQTKLYRTGDWATYDSNKSIRLLGRRDNQVKIMGQRLNLGEVEAILEKCEDVSRAIVLLVGNHLECLIELRRQTSSQPTVKNVEAHCAGLLPKHLVPIVVPVEQIPLTLNGKLDRVAAKRLLAQPKKEQAPNVCPQNAVEDKTSVALRGFVSSLCDTASIDHTTDLDQLGINSLGFIQLKALILEKLNVKIDYATIRTAKTVGALESLISVSSHEKLPAIAKRHDSHRSPEIHIATESQRTVWTAQESLLDNSYNVEHVFEVWNVTVDSVKAALEQILEHFDIFSVTFDWSDDVGDLVIHKTSSPNIEVNVDRTIYAESTGRTFIMNKCAQSSSRVFDLRTGPLGAFKIFNTGKSVIIYENLHHILIDQKTSAMIHSALWQFLSPNNGNQCALPQYTPYTNVTALHSKEQKKQMLSNLKQVHEGISARPLASWPLPVTSCSESFAALARASLDSALLDRANQIAHHAGGSQFTILLSAFQLLLHRATNCSDLGVIVPVTTRAMYTSSANATGNFVQGVLIRSSSQAGVSKKTFADKTAAALNFAIDNAVALDSLLRNIKRKFTDFSIVFTTALDQIDTRDLHIEERSLEWLSRRKARFELHAAVDLHQGQPTFTVEYPSDLFDASFVQRVADQYSDLVREVIEDIEAALQCSQSQGAICRALEKVISATPADDECTVFQATTNKSIASLLAVIADEKRQQLPWGSVGRVWVGGPSVQDANSLTGTAAGWLNTGLSGSIGQDGRLVISSTNETGQRVTSRFNQAAEEHDIDSSASLMTPEGELIACSTDSGDQEESGLTCATPLSDSLTSWSSDDFSLIRKKNAPSQGELEEEQDKGNAILTETLTKEITLHLCDLLDVAHIDKDDNLFEAGLDSFLAMSFIARMKRKFTQLVLTRQIISQRPSIHELSLHLTTGSRESLMSGAAESTSLSMATTDSPTDNIQTSTIATSATNPSQETTALVHDCLCKVLDVDEVPSDENLFEMGLDSFLSMSLCAMLRGKFNGLSITRRDIGNHPDLEQLASFVHQHVSRCSPQTEEIISTRPSLTTQMDTPAEMCRSPDARFYETIQFQKLPASSMQQRFYLLQQIFADGSHNLPFVFEVKNVNLEVVLDGVREMVRSNPIFRTSLVYEEDKVQQRIWEDADFDLPVHDLSTGDTAETEAQVRDLIAADVSAPYDLSYPPFFRAAGLKLPQDKSYFYINFHHSIVDEKSTKLFSEKLEAYCQSPGAWPASESSMTYAEFAVDEQRRLNGAAFQQRWKKHWTKQLEGLPAKIPVFAEDSVHGGLQHAMKIPSRPSIPFDERSITMRYTFDLPKNATLWASQQGATQFEAYFALAQIILLRHFGAGDVGILAATTSRPEAGGADLFGCFVNSLPIRNIVKGDDGLVNHLKESQKTLQRDLDWSCVPLESIMEACKVDRTHFPIMFVYHEKRQAKASIRKLNSTTHLIPRHAEGVRSKFPMQFGVVKTIASGKQALTLNIDFDQDLLAPDMVESLCYHFEQLIHSAAQADPNTTIGSLNILDQYERDFIDQTRYTEPSSAEPLLMSHMDIERQVQLSPLKPCVSFEYDAPINYRQFWNKVTDLASRIHHLATDYDQKICIFWDPSIDRLAAIIAVLRCGFAWVPLDFANPVERNMTIVKRTNPVAILVPDTGDETFLESLAIFRTALSKSAMGNHVLTMATPVQMERQVQLPRAKFLRDTSVAYVLFTSGSTGEPKGVMIQHDGLANATREHRVAYRLGPGRRILQLAPWTFDVSIMDIFPGLTTGAQLCIGRKEWMLTNLETAINSLQITNIATTPTIVALLTPETAPSLKTLGIGGEQMTRVVRDTWGEYAELWNTYGPTEAAVNAVFSRMNQSLEPHNIGRPLGGVMAMVLNEQMVDAVPGQVGELVLGGTQVGRGYLNAPPTDKSYRMHPKHGKIYMTGDYAKHNEKGELICLGRKDDQIKLRGQRIELGEVEAVISKDENIDNAVVLMLNRDGTDALYASLSVARSEARDPHVPLNASLHRHLIDSIIVQSKACLSPYAVPTYWIPFAKLPRNNNNKADRKLIASIINQLDSDTLWTYHVDSDLTQGPPSVDHTVSTSEPSEPQVTAPPANASTATTNEQTVMEHLEKVLGVASLTPSSNFFAISGDSIAAIKLSGSLRKHKIQLRVGDIYRNPTVSGMAACIEPLQSARAGTAATASSINSTAIASSRSATLTSASTVLPSCEGTGDEAKLSPVMDWFFSTPKINHNWYNQTRVLKFKTRVSSYTLCNAWDKIICAHPALRTRFLGNRGAMSMQVLPFKARSHSRLMQSLITDEDDLQSVCQDLQSSLDITTGRLTALGLFSCSSDGPVYGVFAIHHLAVDEVSWGIILQDLESALSHEDVVDETNSTIDWSRYVAARGYRNPSNVTNAKKPGNIKMIASNQDLAENKASKCRLTSFEVSEDISASLQQISTSDEATHDIQDILITAFAQALKQWKHVQEAEICIETHGRDFENEQVDTSRTVGWFTYILPMMIDLSHKTMEQLLRHVSETKKAVLSAQDLAGPIEVSSNAILFNYLGMHTAAAAGKLFETVSVPHGDYEDPQNLRNSLMDVESYFADGKLHLGIFAASSIFAPSALEVLLSRWSNNIAALVQRKQPTPSRPFGLDDDNVRWERFCRRSLTEYGVDVGKIEHIDLATDSQTAMFLSSLESGAYLTSYDYAINARDADFSISRFEQAWNTVLERHSIFRTVFVLCDLAGHEQHNRLLQVVLKSSCSPRIEHATRQGKVQVAYGSPLSRVTFHQSSTGSWHFTWTIHHALIDGWSTRLVLDQVKQAYQGASAQASYPQFHQVASKVQQYTTSSGDIDYWRGLLNTASGTRLEDSTCDVANQSPDTRFMDYATETAFTDVKDYALSNGTTAASVLRAVMGLALAHYSGNADVVFGVTSPGRSAEVPGIDSAIGPFINTVPLRLRVGWSDSVDAFLEQATQVAAEVSEHDSLPLHQIQQSGNSSDLLSVVMDFRPPATPSSSDPSQPYQLTIKKMQEPTDVPFLVKVGVDTHGNVAIYTFVSTSTISGAFVQRFMRSFATILQSLMISSNRASLQDIAYLDPVHANQLQSLATGPKYPSTKATTVWTLFERQARATPRALAADFLDTWTKEREQVTYEELLRQSTNLAKYLHSRGVKQGHHIAIMLDKSPSLIVALLAVMRLGAAYVPLDVDAPMDRNTLLMDEASAFGVIACGQTAALADPRFPQFDVGEMSRSSGLQLHAENSVCDLESLATLMFTSGTTGKPKGVRLPQRQVVGYAWTMAEQYYIHKGSRVFNFARANFDASLTDIFSSLIVGATVCMTPHQQTLDDFPQLMKTFRITNVNVTASVASLLDPDELPDLQQLTLAGEAITATLIKRWADRVKLVNAYGPTEASVITATDVNSQTDTRNIGRPVPGMKVAIVNERHHLTPLGVKGFIACAGRQLAQGYFKRPEETAKAFVSCTFDQGSLMYLTGDMGAQDSHGNIWYLGRNDDQVKINGQRIELLEVENALYSAETPLAVVKHHGPGGKTQLALVFVSDAASATPTATKLRRRARAVLTAAMQPKMSLAIDKLPLSANGKVDRRALAKYVQDNQTSAQKKYVPPAAPNPSEHKIQPMDMEAATHFHGAVTSDAPTLFCVHGSAGISTDFKFLPDYLPNARVIGLHSQKLGHQVGYRSVEHIAQEYTATVLEEQAHGPYFVLGYSFGAHIVLEMAHILKAQGHAVYPILVDAAAEDKFAVMEEPPNLRRACELVLESTGAVLGANEEPPQWALVCGVEWIRNNILMAAHVTRYYDGAASLIKAYDSERHRQAKPGDVTNGFGKIIGDLDTQVVYGKHFDLFTRQDPMLQTARAIARAFDRGLGNV